ncbi:MAG: hypothetical protein KKB20_18555 [Proteobacteria bacterium]|nr:hypothetical protein [Pseudomonadota bacterium]
MRIKDLFEKWNLTGLQVKTGFVDMKWEPGDADKDAAWELYVELLTRVTTQALSIKEGTEAAALSSIFSLFATTRDILKGHGRACVTFSKVAVVVLNQVIRPFTARWHPVFETGSLEAEQRAEFRSELAALREKLISYSHILAEIADVEDITELESP